MAHSHSFAPISSSNAKVLILGSMPGRKSLKENEYYALRQNAFWKIMGELIGAGTSYPYEKRIGILKSSGIALWDVLASCERKSSSADADIEKGSEIENDFETFITQHPQIKNVFFNGSKAEQCFRKFVLEKQVLPTLEFHRLPSTSPAHARMSYEEKLNVWRKQLLEAGVKINP